MAKTSAERQAAYRQKQARAGNQGKRRISTWVSPQADLALARLERYLCLTRQDTISHLIMTADRQHRRNLESHPEELEVYLSVTR